MTNAINEENSRSQIHQRAGGRIGKSLRLSQSSRPLTLVSSPKALTRAYFRRMRAAEMAAWEMTGGDCVLSRFVTQS